MSYNGQGKKEIIDKVTKMPSGSTDFTPHKWDNSRNISVMLKEQLLGKSKYQNKVYWNNQCLDLFCW